LTRPRNDRMSDCRRASSRNTASPTLPARTGSCRGKARK
jgi:hypothetical protein